MIRIGSVALMGDWDTSPPPPDCVVVRLVPSFSEGAGWDTTTQAMLQELQNHLKPGMDVLDFGAGNGVLALAAMALGAKKADAVDWQASSRDVIQGNAKANNIELGIYDKPPAKRYDLILCNLFGSAPTLEALPVLAERLGVKGKIILTSQSAEITEKAESLGLDAAMENHNDWFIGVLTWRK